MEQNLTKFGEEFYDLDVTITGMCCLGLLDCNSQNSVRVLEDLLSCQDEDEMAKLFGLDDVIVDDEIAYDLIIESCNGWLVIAEGAEPRNPRFNKDGEVSSYMSGGVYNILHSYKDTLEEALTDIASQAKALREVIFNKARKEQGLPVVVAVEGAA